MSNLQFIITFSLMMFTIAWLSGCQGTKTNREDTFNLELDVRTDNGECYVNFKGGEGKTHTTKDVTVTGPPQ